MILRGQLDGNMKMAGKFHAKNPDGSYTFFGTFTFGKCKTREPVLALHKFGGLPTWAKLMFTLPFRDPSSNWEQGVIVVEMLGSK